MNSFFISTLKLITLHAAVFVMLCTPLITVAEIRDSGIGSGLSDQGAGTGLRDPGAGTGMVDRGTGAGGDKFSNPLGSGNDSLGAFLSKILDVVVMLGAIVVVFFYIYAGFNFVTARGDSGKIQDAIKTLTWTTVGAMVILGAKVISTAIQGTVTQISGN